jgi:hypothetical protein
MSLFNALVYKGMEVEPPKVNKACLLSRIALGFDFVHERLERQTDLIVASVVGAFHYISNSHCNCRLWVSPSPPSS